MAVHVPFSHKQNRPSNESVTGRCLKMVLYMREVKLGNFMFQTAVNAKASISQVKTKQVHGIKLYVGRQNTKTSLLPDR